MALRPVLSVLALMATPLTAQSLAYRGLEPGIALSDFSRAANRLAAGDSLSCRTSAKTAALMECGVTVADGDARLTISAFVIAGQVGMLSVTDSGGPELVDRWRGTLAGSWGPGTETARAMMQWVAGDRVARLTWRAAGERRWVSLTLAHDPTLARIEEFLPASTRRNP